VNFGDSTPTLFIAGDTHDAIAETAGFFMNLEELTEGTGFFFNSMP
jgi:hypothetical protein